MQNRLKRRISPLLVAALACVTLVTARAHAVPSIESVAIDAAASRITISGRSFGATPTVTLGDDTLVIVNASDTEIVAQTSALAAGTYLLTVAQHAGAPDDETATSTVLVN